MRKTGIYILFVSYSITFKYSVGLPCETSGSIQPCILCETCLDKNGKQTICQNMHPFLNKTLKITNKTIIDSCYERGDESELIKHPSFHYQQRISILPPPHKFELCYFNISYHHFLKDVSELEDRLYIGGKNFDETCSERKKWKISKLRQTDYAKKFKYQLTNNQSIGKKKCFLKCNIPF